MTVYSLRVPLAFIFSETDIDIIVKEVYKDMRYVHCWQSLKLAKLRVIVRILNYSGS